MTNEELQKYIECVENKLHDRDRGNIHCQAKVETLENFTIKIMEGQVASLRKSVFNLQMAIFCLFVMAVCCFVK